MSGGINAIKGFDYQSTVILDFLIPFFDEHEKGIIRPEGIDDLDLQWFEGSIEQKNFIQIKKPREDLHGNLKNKPWTLTNAVNDLLPNTITNLIDNNY